jgi:hypothetical protein
MQSRSGNKVEMLHPGGDIFDKKGVHHVIKYLPLLKVRLDIIRLFMQSLAFILARAHVCAVRTT